MAKITVLGAGGWGLALALTLNENNHEVFVWSPFSEEVDAINATRQNEKLLKGITIPSFITVTTDMSVASGSDVTVIATPSFAVRQTAAKLKNIKDVGIVVNVASGEVLPHQMQRPVFVYDFIFATIFPLFLYPSNTYTSSRSMPDCGLGLRGCLREQRGPCPVEHG